MFLTKTCLINRRELVLNALVFKWNRQEHDERIVNIRPHIAIYHVACEHNPVYQAATACYVVHYLL